MITLIVAGLTIYLGQLFVRFIFRLIKYSLKSIMYKLSLTNRPDGGGRGRGRRDQPDENWAHWQQHHNRTHRNMRRNRHDSDDSGSEEPAASRRHSVAADIGLRLSLFTLHLIWRLSIWAISHTTIGLMLGIGQAQNQPSAPQVEDEDLPSNTTYPVLPPDLPYMAMTPATHAVPAAGLIRQRATPSAPPLESETDNEEQEDSREVPAGVQCVVCLERARTRLLRPCNHLCLCESCADQVLEDTGQCPLCRANVHSTLNVYL